MRSIALAIGLLVTVPLTAHGQAPPDPLGATMLIAGGGESVPLVEERVAVTIDGQYATTTLTQVYENTQPGQIEGRYRLQPGSGSHVEGFAYWNGEAKIVGEVFERQLAHQVYDRVTSRQRDPGLLEEDGEGAFAFKVFPIQAREKKRIELRWSKWLERNGTTVMYRVPIGRADTSVALTLTGKVKNLRSNTHAFHREAIAGGERLRFDGARGQRELVLMWDVDEPAWTPTLAVHQEANHDGWFTLALAAPDLPATAVSAKDVTIVIDRSGSMEGEPMAQARAAGVDMIKRLPATDRVNVIAFSDEVDPLFAAPQVLDSATRERAIAFVEKLADGGGTDIGLALETAIKAQDRAQPRPRVVVFLTDGQSDVDKTMKAAAADTGDIRLFTVGLGPQVNRPLLSRLAAQKRGRFTFIAKTSAIQQEVARLAGQIAKPLLIGVTVEIEGAQAVRLYPRTLPDLFAHDELVVSGRLRGQGGGKAKVTVRGTLAGKPVAYTTSVDLATAPPRPWVGRMWAHARVQHLLEEIALGDRAPELVTEVTELALAYNFVTPYTAFLAIPEAELGDQRGAVMEARARKAKIMADNPDVAALDADDGEDAAEKSFVQGAPAAMDSESYATVARRGGCASCSTGAPGPAGFGLWFLVGLMMLRARRARGPGRRASPRT